MIFQAVEFFEKKKFTPLTAFIFLVILGIIRSVTESIWFEYRVFSLYLIVQHTAFNFPVLVMGVLILSIASKTSLIKVYNAVLLGFVLVIMPPFMDYFVLGQYGAEYSHLYAYYAAEFSFIDKIPGINPIIMLTSEEISAGLRRMVLSIMTFSAFYIAIKIEIWDLFTSTSKKIWHKILKKFSALYFGVFGIWLVVWFISNIVPSVISMEEKGIVVMDYFVFRPYSKYYVFMLEHGYTETEVFSEEGFNMAYSLLLQQRSLFVTMFFFLLTITMILLSLYILHRTFLKKTLASLKVPLLISTTFSALLGSSVIHLIDPDFSQGLALDPSYVLHFPYIFYIAIMGFFLGCFGSYIIQFKNEERIISKYKAKQMAIISLLGGGSFAFLMGPFRALPIFLICAGLIYLAFKDGEYIFNFGRSALFSLACMLSFFIGVNTPDVWRLTVIDHGSVGTLTLARNPQLTGEILGLALVIFTVVFLITYLPTLLEKLNMSHEFPVSLVFLPIFFIPLLFYWTLGLLTVIGSLGVITSILYNKELHLFPLSTLMIGMSYLILELYGLAPSIL